MAHMSLRLHPVHFAPDGGDAVPEALAWNMAPGSPAERLKQLTKEAAAFLPDCKKDVPNGAHSILKTRNHLVFRHPATEDILVPLLMLEVGYASAEQTSVVVLARPCASSGTETGGEAWQGKQYSIWLVVVQGGALGLHTFLNILSVAGAIRGDFAQMYDVPPHPFAGGACACVYKIREKKAEGDGRQSELLAAKALRVGHRRALAKAQMEARLLRKAQGHPNVNQLVGLFYSAEWAGQEDDWSLSAVDKEEDEKRDAARFRLVLVMELCTRGSLYDRVLQRGAYVESEALEVTSGLLSALEHVHEQGIVHRDVKPDNILRGADGRPVLTDFGIAAFVSDKQAMQERCGTPGYAAPEVVIKTYSYGKKVDVFGAGGVLYFCLFGAAPFGKRHASVEEVVEATVYTEVKFPECRAVTEQMRQFIMILLTKDPDDRPSATGALNVLKLFPCSQFAPAAPKTAAPELVLPKAKDSFAPGGDASPAGGASPSPFTPVLPATPPPGQKRRPAMGRSLLPQRYSARGSEQQGGRPSGQQPLLGQERPSGQERQSFGDRLSGNANGRSNSFRMWWKRSSEDKSPTPPTSEDGAERSPSTATSSPTGIRSNSYSPSWFHRGRKVSAASSSATTDQRTPKQPVPIVDKLCPSFLARRRADATAGARPSN